MQKLLILFQHTISIHVYALFNDQSFKDTNDILSFEQLGPVLVPVDVLNNSWMSVNQCRCSSDATFCSV